MASALPPVLAILPTLVSQARRRSRSLAGSGGAGSQAPYAGAFADLAATSRISPATMISLSACSAAGSRLPICSAARRRRSPGTPNPVLARNYDLHPDLNEGVIIRTGWSGRRVLGTSEFLWGLADGMNEDGLALSLAFGGSREVGPGFGITLILRYVLEVCTTVPDALEVLARLPSHMAYNVTLLDRHGAAKTVQLAPARRPQDSRPAGRNQSSGYASLDGVCPLHRHVRTRGGAAQGGGTPRHERLPSLAGAAGPAALQHGLSQRLRHAVHGALLPDPRRRRMALARFRDQATHGSGSTNARS